ncbi:MAG: phenylalanine--tRNA ligase subunit beta [Lentimicrobiaceae bacterium]|jgi:phenylalanyl-tRNA synthetase beta chain|nr:phenylalanine--tRNA ligase subunit beta [Lentimicrobiaceae bacterium]MBT3454653.1 phenylalanine--tRNA ligase subunit beta [Lentimicrobiaceae bacterium]MBT3819742.1 phenylalanine--tRNA ligase subunit beta [Lentimicrobiaceae bacterium]MBT4061179.1 phenylalanine--tRNA ligase subunit beta [Lentimicrobiaceae bacterium]MBT4191339.1 phenylalanine--tRNA ligase subunit beta [Lentimicrobiaceae bacterium]
MKISYNWLKQYINLDIEPEKLSKILTDIGLEVEGIEIFQSVRGGLEGIVIGEVISCKEHPNADKLSITTVDVAGDKLLPIVCGAPNVAEGQKVVVATVGTTLYSDDNSFKIKKAKIRGEVSEGMICAEDELGLGDSHDGIIVLPGSTKVGTTAAEYFKIEEDIVFEIGLTPNRSDATSHIGTARDLVAGLNMYYNTNKYMLNIPSVENFSVSNNNLNIDVTVEDKEACPRYSGVTISGVKVGDSPQWLKIKLESIGVRPINNIVDITNYVLHETGQPLHAFDAKEITGNTVVVKKMEKNTPFVTLDELDRKLDENDLMICNSTVGMCIAGVFGGIKSGVDESTVDLFLESAYFDSKHIRKTSKRHGLQTDASFRFERGADPSITIYALKRASSLIVDIAGGQISSEIKDVYPKTIKPWEVNISLSNVDRLIGKHIDREIIKKILTDLEIDVLESSESSMRLLVPTFKVDVTREVDIIEEVLRIYGYNNIDLSGKINTSIGSRPFPDMEKVNNSIADYLVSQGLTEIMNNSLTKGEYTALSDSIKDANNVKLLNPLSRDLNSMRQSMIFGGLETISYNVNRKSTDLKLFEFGKTYRLNHKHKIDTGVKHYHEENSLLILATGSKNKSDIGNHNDKVDFQTLTGLVNSIFIKLGVPNSIKLQEKATDIYDYSLQYNLNENPIAEVSKVNSKLLSEFDISQEVYCAVINWTLTIKYAKFTDVEYVPVSKFPSVKRDLSLIIDNNIRFADLKQVALAAERKLLKNVTLFDVYEGSNIAEGKKSYAMSFILQDESKTLTDKVIDKSMKRIQSSLEQQFNAQLR